MLGWPAIPVLAFALWRSLTRFDWRYAAGILPWFAQINRQMYYFYMAPVAPFLVLATVLLMGEILGPAGASRERRQTGLLVVGLWVGEVVANFIWLWPILVGQPISPKMWDTQLWLPSHRAVGIWAAATVDGARPPGSSRRPRARRSRSAPPPAPPAAGCPSADTAPAVPSSCTTSWPRSLEPVRDMRS